MSAAAIGGIGAGALFALLFLRVPVWAALTLVGLFGNAAISGWTSTFAVAGLTPFDSASAYELSVIPLFVFMGEVASQTRLSSDLFVASRVMLSGLRGGLSVATLAASACFGAVCGSSVATAATMTRIALPEMRKAGYDSGLATGSLAAGGSLGILIPPSIILVIYAAIAEQSVPKLFAASMIPGLVLTALYIIVAIIVCHFRPNYAPVGKSLPMRERIAALKGPWQFLLIFIVSIGGIYAGVFSPTEAAAIGAFGAIALGILGRRLTLPELWKTIESSVVIGCVLFAIIFGANIYSFFMVQTHLPALLADSAKALALPPLMVMTLMIITYIVLGCFLEGIGMVLITVPVFLPLIVSLGYDPIWFAVIVVIVVEVGMIHPPVGMNLFVIQAQAPEIKITSIYRGIIPFLFAPLVLIVILFMWPDLALWLPKVLYK
jgi:tripartite ATP-independent transporter DctM subunit